MKISNFERILLEDYPSDERPLVSKLGSSINGYTDDVSEALDNNLSISDNLNWKRTSLVVTVDASGTPTASSRLQTGLNGPCGGTQVIKSVNNTLASGYPTGTPFISFTEQNGMLTVNNITNLLANNKYTLTVILYPTN